MANLFSRSKGEPEPSLRLSNGSTSVLFDVLALAACSLAETDWEVRFAIACCDSTRVGLGMDGFALEELPWRADAWEAERDFVLRVVDRASARHRWDVLGYDPPTILEGLKGFRELVAGYVPSLPSREPLWRWPSGPIDDAARLCAEHPVFVGTFGACRFCRPDMDLDAG